MKTENVNGDEYDIFDYHYWNPTFWEIPDALFCRGITFRNGVPVSVPYKKIGNLCEHSSCSLNNSTSLYLLEKLDGSMIHPVINVYEDSVDVMFKTRASFYSDVAKSANKFFTDGQFLKTVTGLSDWFKMLKCWNLTPVFEYIDPDYRVVIDYGKNRKMVLTGIVSENGDTLPMDYMLYSEYHKLERPESLGFVEYQVASNFDDLLILRDTVNGVEGWVVRGQEGTVKVKTKWYFNLHSMIDYTENSVAKLVYNNRLDDVKGLLSGEPILLAQILDVETRVMNLISQLYADLDIIANNIKHMNSRDAYDKYGHLDTYKLATIVSKGKVPNLDVYFHNKILPTFSTRKLSRY